MKIKIFNNDVLEHIIVVPNREAAIKWCENHKIADRDTFNNEITRLAIFNNAQYVIDIRKFHSSK